MAFSSGTLLPRLPLFLQSASHPIPDLPFLPTHRSLLPRPGSSNSTPLTPRPRRPVPQEQVDMIHDMFPHVSPSAIRYDLEISSRDVNVTVEKCVRGLVLPEVSTVRCVVTRWGRVEERERSTDSFIYHS